MEAISLISHPFNGWFFISFFSTAFWPFFGNGSNTVRQSIGRHNHSGQSDVRVALTLPICLGLLLVGICPVINLLLDKLAGVQCPKRRAGKVQIIIGGYRQPGFVAGIATHILLQIFAVISVLVLLLKQLFGVIFPGAKVIFIKNHQIPVGRRQRFCRSAFCSSIKIWGKCPAAGL